MAVDKFRDFDLQDLSYNKVLETDLQATVFIPKSLRLNPSAKYPVLVYWHGGGFVVGHRAYEGWFPSWMLQLAQKTPCIIISPDYRLLPESNAVEILSDVEAFWIWLRDSAPALMSEWHARPDLSQIACVGTSAGGYLAVQSALLFGHLVSIRALISICGSLNTDISHYRIPGPKTILGKKAPPPHKAEAIIRAYVKALKPDAVRLAGDPVEMWEFLTCVLQQAYLPRWLGMRKQDHLDIMKNLDKVESNVPPIWVVQGNNDSVVPPICATGFKEKMDRVKPETPLLLSLEQGDHGFEVPFVDTTPWVKEGLDFIARYWPLKA